MADASALRAKKIPDSLYELCLSNVVNYIQKFKCNKNDLRALPDSILMDVYFKMYQESRLCNLVGELSELDIFERLLRYSGLQLRLLQCFQAVIGHGSKLSTELASSYVRRCEYGKQSKDSLIDLGLRLGGFLNEAGWYEDAERVLVRCRDICQAQPQTTHYKRLTLECCHRKKTKDVVICPRARLSALALLAGNSRRLLNTQSSYCCFPAAAKTYSLALRLLGLSEDETDLPEDPLAVAEKCVKVLQDEEAVEDNSGARASASAVWGGGGGGSGLRALVARVLNEFSALFFVRCDYNRAHAWSLRALVLLDNHTPHKIVVEVLRTCGKACVVKRQFGRAGLLVRAAAARARASLPPHHPAHAHALQDLGFYLLNVDSINRSVAVYEKALVSLERVFGRRSLHVATAQEDLAYALYVLEYSSGRFYKAKKHAERAIHIIETLVPGDHLLLASAKRVKALILEEIALDSPAGHHDINEPSLLEESESLHKAALKLSLKAFGEMNVQTAKHYGNLGRLYQSMQKFHDAETMHLKAIAIKEELLGPDDYEVGLSIGHLASLYNYHMHAHCAAEKLYMRSIAISLKLFGERYSGLEYDYRGLVHVFTHLKRHDRADHYERLLQHWHELREQSKAEPQPPLDEQVMPIDELLAKFFGND